MALHTNRFAGKTLKQERDCVSTEMTSKNSESKTKGPWCLSLKQVALFLSVNTPENGLPFCFR
jgi:hypothetical protein